MGPFDDFLLLSEGNDVLCRPKAGVLFKFQCFSGKNFVEFRCK